MTVRVWKTMALTTALLVLGATGQAQSTTGAAGGTTAGVAGSGKSGQGAVPQVRPAPVTGRVAADPAAVALRPAAQQPLTSTARQVPPPANPNEPLLTPESEQVKAPSSVRHAQRSQSGQGQEAAVPEATPTRPHVDRTHGVKKTNETPARPHARKTKGKPHHASQKASSVEPRDERRHGGKRGSQAPGKPVKQAAPIAGQQRAVPGRAAIRHKPRHHTKPEASHKAAARAAEGQLHAHHPNQTTAHGKQAGTSSKAQRAQHVHEAAARASAPVAKKPVRHQHPSA